MQEFKDVLEKTVVTLHPADAVVAWKALQCLPSQQASVLQNISQNVTKSLTEKQQAQALLHDAQGDLQECLSEVQAEGGNVAGAVKACLLAAVQDLQVSCHVSFLHQLAQPLSAVQVCLHFSVSFCLSAYHFLLSVAHSLNQHLVSQPVSQPA